MQHVLVRRRAKHETCWAIREEEIRIADGHLFRGTLSLKCFQEMQNGRPALDRMDHLILCGATKQPFEVAGGRVVDDSSTADNRGSSDYAPAPPLLRDSPAVFLYRFGVAFR